MEKVNHASSSRWQEATPSSYTLRAPTLCKALDIRCHRNYREEAQSLPLRSLQSNTEHYVHIYSGERQLAFLDGVLQAKCVIILGYFI